jgi:hypothetical protein
LGSASPGVIADNVELNTKPAVPTGAQGAFDSQITQNAAALLAEERTIFRYDTFGSEIFWGDAL